MTEFEKMISGEMYDARDAYLTECRQKARRWLGQINQSAAVPF